MIRFATQADLPAILDIYGPYVLHTAVSFEYSVPTLEEFTDRFRSITAQFPWLVWEEDGKILGYAYGSLPFGRAAYRWCSASSIYLAPEAQGRGMAENYTKRWKPSSQNRATARPTPSSPLTIPVPCVFTSRQASVSWQNFLTAALNLINFTVSFGWKKP